MSLVNILSSYICQTSYHDLPEAVISVTKERVLDFLGVALLGYKHNVHTPILKVLEKYRSDKGSTVIGEGVELPGDLAALINSSMCFDLTDGSRAAALHPGPVVIPAALAAAESYSGAASGKNLILAIALGYEVMIRVGRAMNPSAVKRGFHLTSVVGPLGSAAATGKIMQLDEKAMADALSIATVSGSGLLEVLSASEPLAQVQIARASQAGLLSVLLGHSGIKGDDNILQEAFIPAFSDEYNLELIEQDLKKEYMIPQTYIKMHAGCRHIHAPIDAALYIVNKHRIDWRDVTQIKVKIYSVAFDFEIEAPKTDAEAKFSIPFGIAVALIFGDAFVEKFTEQNLKDRQIRNLMRKVTVEHDPDLDKEYPAKRGAGVEITTKEGKVFSHILDMAKGEPEYPYSKLEIEDKFKQLTSELIDPETGQKIIDFVDRLEESKDISSLFTLLTIK